MRWPASHGMGPAFSLLDAACKVNASSPRSSNANAPKVRRLARTWMARDAPLQVRIASPDLLPGRDRCLIKLVTASGGGKEWRRLAARRLVFSSATSAVLHDSRNSRTAEFVLSEKRTDREPLDGVSGGRTKTPLELQTSVLHNYAAATPPRPHPRSPRSACAAQLPPQGKSPDRRTRRAAQQPIQRLRSPSAPPGDWNPYDKSSVARSRSR
jgi:hypothetical protein